MKPDAMTADDVLAELRRIVRQRSRDKSVEAGDLKKYDLIVGLLKRTEKRAERKRAAAPGPRQGDSDV